MMRIMKHLLLALTYGLLGSFIVIVGLYVYQQESSGEGDKGECHLNVPFVFK
jgi:hypothetical protein